MMPHHRSRPRLLTLARLLILFLALLPAFTAAPARAASMTFTVTNLVDGGPGSLRSLILVSAGNGDIIQFAPGLNGSTLALRGELVIESSVTILGPGPANLMVSGAGSNRVFNIRAHAGGTPPTVLVAGLTISGGNGRTDPFSPFPPSPGGAILNSATLTLSNCTLTGNATSRGGAIYNSTRLTLLDCTLRGNSSGQGGTLENDFGTVALTNTLIRDNWGAGVCSATGTVQMSQCLLQGNRGGGLVNSRGTGAVVNCVFNGNSASDGGALNCSYATMTMKSCTLSGNSADDNGGAIYAYLTALTVQNCTLDGNLAGGDGGGLYCSSAEPTNLVLHSTFSGNVAYQGGAIHNEHGPLTLLHSTLCDNATIAAADDSIPGGTLYHDGFDAPDLLTVGHTLVARNILGLNYVWRTAGQHRSLGFNLSDDGSFSDLFELFDVVTTDARLGPLADNGGSTFTHALLPGSPAIDAGISQFITGVTNDQRGPGFPRRVGPAVDIGAFEYASSTAAPRFVLAQKVPAGLRLNVQGLPNELLRIETNALPGPAGWKTFVSRAADGSGNLAVTNTGIGAAGPRFYRAVRP